ncbi:probable LRR receptor-like serine/threonine-protein kinase At3g47570 [Quercus suber]|uniref:probable LRR receptor-like serine/threonine-protein kinase At3g47570 n=1 Tax=Quercus suber TaxID=58331 RepID=UPI0032DFACF2
MVNFGSVYKGILDQGRHTIAIKVLNLLRHGASKSFMAECEALQNIRHRNIVKVLTSCSSIDYQGNDFKALVYEFMANGNLDEWLHPTLRTGETLEERRNLSLLQRLDIAIDVANALNYLHYHCHTPIIHCDLKPSNVLLDDEMVGHVDDFGLARLLFDAAQDYSIHQSSSIGIRGTIGYTSPVLPEQIIDIIDPILLRVHEREGETRTNNITHNEGQNGSVTSQECLIMIFKIGVACSVEFPREWMNKSADIIELHSIRQKLLGTNRHRQRLQSTGAQE